MTAPAETTVRLADVLVLDADDPAQGSYVLPMHDIAEVAVISRAGITAVPGTPPWLLGVTGWHGRVLAVCDLAQRLGLPAATSDRPCVVLSRGGVDLGLMGLRVTHTAAVDLAERQPTPQRVAPAIAALVSGQVFLADEHSVAQTPALVLDAAALLQAPSLQ